MQCYSQFIFIGRFASQSHKQNGNRNIMMNILDEMGIFCAFGALVKRDLTKMPVSHSAKFVHTQTRSRPHPTVLRTTYTAN